MKVRCQIRGIDYEADLKAPIDISIPLIPGSTGPNCFWAPLFDAVPVRSGDWIGDTLQGGIVNFKNVSINPHGNGTHTETVGHIATEMVSINSVLTSFHFTSLLLTIYPQSKENGDRVITLDQLVSCDIEDGIEALIIRTMPNDEDKKTRIYGDTNPPYIDVSALSYIREKGIKHLLVDLPSVDREVDGGALAGHRAYWAYPETIDRTKTITELIFVDNVIKDGLYLLNIQIASFELDASPSKPIIYQLKRCESA